MDPPTPFAQRAATPATPDRHARANAEGERDNTALRRLFAAAVDGADKAASPPPPPNQVDLDPQQKQQQLEVEDDGEDALPVSWPRAFTRKTSLTHPVGRLHAPSQSPARPMSAAAVAREQLHQQQQQDGHPPSRFFRSKTLEPTGHHLEAEAEAEPQDEVSMLREQVALLLKNLEGEKKRRMHEQKLMQEKIMELQGLIRRNLPEQQKAQERRLVQMRSPSAARTKSRSGSKHAIRGAQLGRKSSKSSDELSALVRKLSKCEGDELPHPPSSKSSDDVGALSDYDDDSPRSLATHEDDVKQPAVASSASASAPAPASASASVAPVKGAAPSAVMPTAQTDKENQSGFENETPQQVEARFKTQLTRLRARMQVAVTDAQSETQTLRSLLKSETQNHERRERQLRVETNAKLFALEERHASAKKRMTATVTLLSAQLNQLQTENQMLAVELSEKDARIAHLELAVVGMRIVHSSQHGSAEAPLPPTATTTKQH